MTPININSVNVTQIFLGKPLSADELPKELLQQELSALPTPEAMQAQIDYQNSVPQTTVIEKNGDILAVFGDNGWQQTFSNGDVFGSNLSENEIIEQFKNKYGSSLTVNKYYKENAPTMGEVYEQKYGRIPTPKVDYFV